MFRKSELETHSCISYIFVWCTSSAMAFWALSSELLNSQFLTLLTSLLWVENLTTVSYSSFCEFVSLSSLIGLPRGENKPPNKCGDETLMIHLCNLRGNFLLCLSEGSPLAGRKSCLRIELWWGGGLRPVSSFGQWTIFYASGRCLPKPRFWFLWKFHKSFYTVYF